MKALVIYDSFFGNTEKIAQAIGSALAAQAEVQVQRVGDVKPEQLTGLDLLVVGSPTRGFRPTPAISALLKGIPADGLRGVKVAAFDTQIRVREIRQPLARVMLTPMAKLFGYAAKPIADGLKKKGGQEVSPPEGFVVKDTEGPLADGELERAVAWAKGLAVPR